MVENYKNTFVANMTSIGVFEKGTDDKEIFSKLLESVAAKAKSLGEQGGHHDKVIYATALKEFLAKR